MLALAAAVAIAAGFVAWQLRRPSKSSLEGLLPYSRLEAAEANRTALRLARAGQHLEAIPYFRAVVDQDPLSAYAHQNLSSALGNGAQQARTHLGRTDNAVRSSVERIAMLRESIHETERVAQLSTTTDERVLALMEHGRALETWGFPLDARARFRLALSLAPGRPDVQGAVARVEHDLSTGQP